MTRSLTIPSSTCASNWQIGITRRDEQQLEQTLQALAALIPLYQRIDYSKPHAEQTHASLAVAYLANGVQDVVPHNMADVLLEGVRLMGKSAQQLIFQGRANEIRTLSEKIASIGLTGCAKESHRVVTMKALSQFAILTFDLVRCESGDIRFAIQDIQRGFHSEVQHLSGGDFSPGLEGSIASCGVRAAPFGVRRSPNGERRRPELVFAAAAVRLKRRAALRAPPTPPPPAKAADGIAKPIKPPAPGGSGPASAAATATARGSPAASRASPNTSAGVR